LREGEMEAGKPPTRRRRRDKAHAHKGRRLWPSVTGAEGSPRGGMVIGRQLTERRAGAGLVPGALVKKVMGH
jgi:hypothetical protein